MFLTCAVSDEVIPQTSPKTDAGHFYVLPHRDSRKTLVSGKRARGAETNPWPPGKKSSALPSLLPLNSGLDEVVGVNINFIDV